MTTPHRVETLIIGGGIGGLSAALALARHDRRAHVLEEAPEFKEIGYGIQLAPNALAVLDQLGVLDAVLKDGFFPQAGVMMSAVSGEPITRIDFGDGFRSRYGYPYVVTHRSDLLAALLAGCRESGLVGLENDRHVVRVDSTDAFARVECADGSVYEADAVIGADGMRSAARRYTVGDLAPVCAEDVAYRGTAPTSEISEDAGLDNVVWWIGPKMHLIHYPIRRGELFNQVAVFSSDHYRQGMADHEWGTPQELEERFDGMCDYVRLGVRRVGRDRWWTLHDLDPVDNWNRNRVTLLGDAAHAMLQYLAQGAAQALEDSACLGYCMAKQPDDVPAAFAAYQAERLPRVTRVQTWARRMGEIVHADGAFAIVRDKLLAAGPEADFEYIDWLYGYRTPS